MLTCRLEDGHVVSLRHVVVDTVVARDHEVLLVRRAPHLLEGGKWGLVGGYVERDESTMEAVQREVREETGRLIHDLRLLRIVDTPHRAGEDRQNFSFVFMGTAGHRVGSPDDESDVVRWWPLATLPSNLAFDHAESLALYRDFLAGRVRIPVLPWTAPADADGAGQVGERR